MKLFYKIIPLTKTVNADIKLKKHRVPEKRKPYLREKGLGHTHIYFYGEALVLP
jgi:hypothetical protein